MTTEHLETEIDQIVHGDHSDPFHILGAHAVQIPLRAWPFELFFRKRCKPGSSPPVSRIRRFR